MRPRGQQHGPREGDQRGQAVREEAGKTIDSLVSKSFINDRVCPFKIATGTSDVAENVIVKVLCGNEFGIGCASPSDVTHETLESIETFLAKAAKKLEGTDETDITKLHSRLDAIAPGNTAAKAGIDIAVYDLLGKRDKKPLYRYLGGKGRDRMLTAMTLSIESKDVTVRKAVQHTKKGFRALKIKVGLDLEGDIKRVAAVRDVLGPGIELRVDANQGYTVDQATRFCEEMHVLGVVVVEQPVKADDLAGLKKVSARSPVPVMADECVKSVKDAKTIASDRMAKMFNIKLMKSAGLHDALAINGIAEGAGMGCMVGCMGEIQVSIAAGLHFALSSPNVRYADLDSHFNIIGDPSSGLEFEDGELVAPPGNGLGIRTPLDG